MARKAFQIWLSAIDTLIEAQKTEVGGVLAGTMRTMPMMRAPPPSATGLPTAAMVRWQWPMLLSA